MDDKGYESNGDTGGEPDEGFGDDFGGDLAGDDGIDLGDVDTEMNDMDTDTDEGMDTGSGADEFDGDLNDNPEPVNDSSDTKSSSLHDDLNNPDLFTDNRKGEYDYSQGDHGKSARGNLDFTDNPERDPKAQLEAGGEDREDKDDGGHLIGARYGGASGAENLDAQNRDVNRRGFKGTENEWAADLKAGGKVFVNVENYTRDGTDRPDATMGYSITENADGSRTWDAFSFQNASYEEQAGWEDSVAAMDDDDYYQNPMRDNPNFDEDAYNQAMNEDLSSKRTGKK